MASKSGFPRLHLKYAIYNYSYEGHCLNGVQSINYGNPSEFWGSVGF